MKERTTFSYPRFSRFPHYNMLLVADPFVATKSSKQFFARICCQAPYPCTLPVLVLTPNWRACIAPLQVRILSCRHVSSGLHEP